MLFLVGPTTPMLRDRIRAGEFGAIITAATGNRIDDMPVWAADNGCFGKTYPGDAAWLRWLERNAEHASRCLFAVVPDVPYDARATLRQYGRYVDTVRNLGYRPALAAQNGLEYLPVPWDDLDVLFLGGDTPWKLGLAAAQLTRDALERGKPVHAGRVNGGKRWAYFRALGCASADGGCVNRAPDKNVGRPAKWAARHPLIQGVLA